MELYAANMIKSLNLRLAAITVTLVNILYLYRTIVTVILIAFP